MFRKAMIEMKDIILIGGGGHCRSVIDSIKSGGYFNIIGILDSIDKVGQTISGIKIIGCDYDAEKFFKQGYKNAFITVGSIEDTTPREKIYSKLQAIGFEFPIIVDRTAIVAKDVVIEQGVFIGKGAIINSNVNIGLNCIINTGCIIEHDCIINKFSHIAPGSTLSGGVQIGKNAHIGANSTIIQYKKVGDNTIIGAGSVVIKDIGNNKKAYGNPCKEVL